MKSRERQRENRRSKNKATCPQLRCAGNKEGFCSVLKTSDFGNKMCPFFKTAEQNEKEKKATRDRLIALNRQELIDTYYGGRKGGVDDGR